MAIEIDKHGQRVRVTAENRMMYEDGHEQCLCIKSLAAGKTYAFIQAVDLSTNCTKRYWGPLDNTSTITIAQSIEQILLYGGKWPELPAAPADLDR